MTPPLPIAPDLPPPHPALRASVAIPARNEEERLPRTLEALARQRDLAGQPLDPEAFEVTVVANGCTDETAEVARRVGRQHPRLRLHVVELDLAPEEAHVGGARRLGMNAACARLLALGRPGGAVLSTDADTEPAPGWIAANLAEIDAGADAVGGRVLLHPAERAGLDPRVRRSFLLDVGYHRWRQELESLLDPDPHDPFPRHHQHAGASFAITAAAYAGVGGLPALRHAEDVALFEAVRRADGRFRHSFGPRVFTSARAEGRAPAGLSDGLRAWAADVERCGEHRLYVESAASLERRFELAGQVRRLWHRRGRLPHMTTEIVGAEVGLSRVELASALCEAPTAGAAVAWAKGRREASDTPVPPEPIEVALAGLRERVMRLRAARHTALPERVPPQPLHLTSALVGAQRAAPSPGDRRAQAGMLNPTP